MEWPSSPTRTEPKEDRTPRYIRLENSETTSAGVTLPWGKWRPLGETLILLRCPVHQCLRVEMVTAEEGIWGKPQRLRQVAENLGYKGNTKSQVQKGVCPQSALTTSQGHSCLSPQRMARDQAEEGHLRESRDDSKYSLQSRNPSPRSWGWKEKFPLT